MEHPEISYKLSKTIKQVGKVSQIGGADNHLYSETRKNENIFEYILNEKKLKNSKDDMLIEVTKYL